MKKLMFAAAVAAAGGLMAIESANVVGYQNLDTNVGGAKMKSAPFIGCDGTAGTWISSLKPQGYEANQDLIDGEGTTGEFNIQLLTKSGGLAGLYTFVRSYDPDAGEWNDDAHWVNPNGDEVVAGTSTDYLFPAGSGMWTIAPDYADDDGADYTVTTAGAVSTNDVKFVLNAGGAKACGNPFPVGVKLSSLVPTGYLNNQDLIDGEGITGEINIQLLTSTGGLAGLYTWVQSYDADAEEWNDDGHWVNPNGDVVVAGTATDYTISAGEGLWILAPDYAEDDGAEYSITIKYPGTL